MALVARMLWPRARRSARVRRVAARIGDNPPMTDRGWFEGEDESTFLSDSAGSEDGMDGLRNPSAGLSLLPPGSKSRLAMEGGPQGRMRGGRTAVLHVYP